MPFYRSGLIELSYSALAVIVDSQLFAFFNFTVHTISSKHKSYLGRRCGYAKTIILLWLSVQMCVKWIELFFGRSRSHTCIYIYSIYEYTNELWQISSLVSILLIPSNVPLFCNLYWLCNNMNCQWLQLQHVMYVWRMSRGALCAAIISRPHFQYEWIKTTF